MKEIRQKPHNIDRFTNQHQKGFTKMSAAIEQQRQNKTGKSYVTQRHRRLHSAGVGEYKTLHPLLKILTTKSEVPSR